MANAAAAAYARRPPFVSYRVEVRATGASLPPLETHAITLRTSDERALVDDPGGAAVATVAAPLPLGPAVDALAEWAFAFDTTGGHVRLDVAYERPKQYLLPSLAPGDTIVVASIGGYAVHYAGADATHLRLEPASGAMRAFAARPNDFVYSDVWFDAGSYLPTRVLLAAAGETFELDYGVAQGNWLLSGFTYDGKPGTRRDVVQPVHVEAAYSNYAFPASVPALEGPTAAQP